MIIDMGEAAYHEISHSLSFCPALDNTNYSTFDHRDNVIGIIQTRERGG